ncbi:MAG: DEAD/DEAH box helicase [Clostridiales bacterium]|jgi:superfamily II DNA/RNA helicase|nr:DEAD/DEAH box helicase [Clostridiales bacterium]
MENTFETLTNPALAKALACQNIRTPSPIQAAAIPAVLSRKDLIAASETGSGKTLAYLLPIFMMLDREIKNPQAIVVAPTHELAAQVLKQAELLVKNADGYDWIEPAVLIGGANLQRQLEKLKKKPRLIIGSAGRILELIRLKKLTSHFVKTIVLDEADRLCHPQNLDQLTALIKTTLADRQIVLFSASIDQKTVATAKPFLKDPVSVDIRLKDALPENISHICFEAEFRDKIKVLRKIVHSENIKKAIVFMDSTDSKKIDTIAERLKFHGINCVSIYGGTKKHDRRQALADFREDRARLLIASDLAARGLDFKGLTHVINYDMPEDAEIYLHRAGRCGRMGEKGVAVSLITPGEREHIRAMEKKFHIDIKEKKMSFGQIKDKTAKKEKSKSVPRERDTNPKSITPPQSDGV